MHRITVVGQSGVDFRAVPADPFVQNDIDYVRALQPETSELFSRIKHDQTLYQLGKELPLTGMSPANVRVQVLDMNSDGRPQKVAEYLSKAGFYVLKIRPAPANLLHNQVRWAPDMHLQRQGSDAVPPRRPLRCMGQTFGPGGAIVVVVGPDFPPAAVARGSGPRFALARLGPHGRRDRHRARRPPGAAASDRRGEGALLAAARPDPGARGPRRRGRRRGRAADLAPRAPGERLPARRAPARACRTRPRWRTRPSRRTAASASRGSSRRPDGGGRRARTRCATGRRTS